MADPMVIDLTSDEPTITGTASHSGARSSRRYRHWFFTLNNPDGSDEEFMELLKADARMKCIVFQREVAPQTGTVHLQGYYRVHNGITLTAMNANRPIPLTHACIQVCRNAKKAVEYCQKDETRAPGHQPHVWGDLPQQGHRSDLEELFGILNEEPYIPYWELCLQTPAAGRYPTAVKRFCESKCAAAPRHLSTAFKGRWIYGPPGVGKSHKAWELLPEAYDKSGDHRWWPNYRGQKSFILDEFCAAIPLQLILKWCDRYPCSLEIKGAHTELQAEECIIISNDPPWDMYKDVSPLRRAALLRRFVVEEAKPKPNGELGCELYSKELRKADVISSLLGVSHSPLQVVPRTSRSQATASTPGRSQSSQQPSHGSTPAPISRTPQRRPPNPTPESNRQALFAVEQQRWDDLWE